MKNNKGSTAPKRRTWLLVITLCSGVLLAGATAWVLANQPTETPAGEAGSLRDKVGQLVVLPSGEDPAIATVTERMIHSDRFLKQAKAGDKLLLYYKSLKAYLYRPSINKVVDVGPITVDPAAAEIQGTRITIRGGAHDAKTNAYRARLAAIYKSAVVLSAQDDKTDAENTVVVDLTDNNQKYNLVNNIAATLDIRRSTLPLGETPPPHTDILIIVGKD